MVLLDLIFDNLSVPPLICFVVSSFFIGATLHEHEPEIWGKIKNKAEPEALS